MKPQTKAVNVLEKTSEYLRAGVLQKQPAWYHVVGSNPPTKNFIRKVRYDHPSAEQTVPPPPKAERKPELYNTRAKKSRANLYNIPKLHFVEDELRDLFYSQHPWELSRPKILLENSGEDSKSQDWSSIKQLNKGLDGESVVQRTIYLLNEGKKDVTSAYDTARHEFYRARIEQQIEEQVAKEQNEMFGAGYAQGLFESGSSKEQEIIDKWKVDAVELSKVLEARNVSPDASWANGASNEGGEVPQEPAPTQSAA